MFKWDGGIDKYIDYCPDVDYIMFIDENGDPSLKYIKKCIENQTIDKSSIYFTITGVIIKRII